MVTECKNDNKSKYKAVEAMLYNYNKSKAEIKNLKLDLEILENDYRGMGSISYEERTQATNAFNSSIENETINREERILKLRNKIRLKEIAIQKIDNAKDSLSEEEIFILNERYFKRKSNKRIAALLDIAEQTCCNYKSNIIEKLAFLIFGEENVQN